MTEDIFRSMKQQMVPSDDTVADLLSKIAALEASPESAETTDSFETFISVRDRETGIVSEKPKTQAKKFTTKSIWFYGTAAAASVIVLLSTFSMLGGTNSDDVKDNLGNIINNPDVIIHDDDNDEKVLATDTRDSDNSSSEENEDKKTIGEFFSYLFNKDKNDNKTSNKNTPDNTSGGNSETGGNNPPCVGGNSEEETDLPIPPPPSPDFTVDPDVSKVTPGAPGVKDINWNREILSDNSVSNITISGTNYVVETVTSPSIASSEVKTISLEIPATETTNHTTVKARVMCVRNVSQNFMVAVNANGFKDALLYTNKDYTPSAFGQFISDAGLDSNTSFAKAVYCKGEKIGYSSYQRFNVDGISKLVEKYIFSCKNAELASYNSYQNGNTHVLFKSTKNPTCSTIDFGVSDNGYLYVKLASGNTFTFHIGSKNAQGFISSITGK